MENTPTKEQEIQTNSETTKKEPKLNWFQKQALKRELKKLNKDLSKKTTVFKASEATQRTELIKALQDLQITGDINITETTCSCNVKDCEQTGRGHLKETHEATLKDLQNKTLEELQDLTSQVLEYAQKQI